jgi:hypothetical protein
MRRITDAAVAVALLLTGLACGYAAGLNQARILAGL